MSNFTTRTDLCRVDFFKEHGKWYATEELSFAGLYNKLTVEAVKIALQAQFPHNYRGMWAVVLDPYVVNSFPVMVKHESLPNG